MPWLTKHSPVLLERIVSGLSYLTFGIAGILYSIFKPAEARSLFFRFHFIQSIMLCIISYLLTWCLGFLVESIGGFFQTFHFTQGLDSTMLVLGFIATGINILGKALIGYGTILAFFGKYAEIPMLSSMARKQM